VDLSNRKIFVTGAGGFIGSHLVEALVLKGCKIKAFVHYNSFNSWGWLDHIDKKVMESVEVISGDITDPFGVKESMKECEVVFHLAALIAIPYSYHSPASYVDTNIKGTLNVLQAAKELGIKKIIHTSTSEIYGTAQFVPITEDHPTNPQSPYAATKSGADFLALTFYRSFGLPVIVARPFNTFGPRQSARAIIPTIISQIASGKKEIKLGSLHPTRDLNYVKDTADGFIACAESDTATGEVINLGRGEEISIGDLAKLIAKIMEKDITIIADEKRQRPQKSEVERLLADNKKAKNILHWSPKYSFEEGLIETIKWFQQPENLAMYKPDIYNL